MCIVCHEGLSDSDIEEQLLNVLNTLNFKETNATSISHFSLVALGVNGPIAKERALKIIEAYIEWKKENKLENDNNFFGQPSADLVQEQLDKIRMFNEISVANNLTDVDIKNMFYSDDQDNKNRYTEIFGDPKNYHVEMVKSFDINTTKKSSNQDNLIYDVEDNLEVSKTDIFKELTQQIKGGINRMLIFMDIVLTKLKCLFGQIICPIRTLNEEKEEVYKNRID